MSTTAIEASEKSIKSTTTRTITGPTEVSSDERKRRTSQLLAEANRIEGPERDRLLDEVIVLNIPVAHSLASRYRNRGQQLEELEQVACLALTKAVRAFRPDRGEDLLVFAVPSILGELKRYFRDVTWTVRPPRRVQELRPRIAAAEEQLSQELGRAPLPREIAALLDCEEEDVLEAIDCRDCASPASLDETAPTGADTPWIDRLPSLDAGFDRTEAVAILAPACRRLKARDRQILRMRFYEQLTQQQIADELGVTQVQVSRLLQRIMRDLRRSIGAPPVEHAKAA
ncbi:MAG TPA: sigma-70 family RNA polymerase sigma factor [Nocardioides sp.]|nr:sigma-70 family RNA polymerase sigma factor [Nocardioides sp.]